MLCRPGQRALASASEFNGHSAATAAVCPLLPATSTNLLTSLIRVMLDQALRCGAPQ